MIFKFALRDLLRHWRFSLFFVFNLAIGLTGFITIEAFKNALVSHLSANAKAILSADISVEARREFNTNELAIINNIPAVKSTIVYDFFAMATLGKSSKLLMIKAVESNYPLYGEIKLRSGLKLMEPSAGSENDLPMVWVYPEVLDQFNAKLGDSLKLGSVNFTIADVIEKDATQTFRSAAMAPRIYIRLKDLKSTGLIQFGSTFSKAYLFKLKEESILASVKEKIYKDILDPAIRVETPDSAGEDAGRQLKYLSDYLGLVTLVALFLSAIGASYLFRLYIQSKLKDIAVYRSLGLRAGQAILIYLLQTFILGGFAVVASFIGTSLMQPVLIRFLTNLLPFTLDLKLTVSAFFSTLLLAVFGSASISLPYLLKIREISVSQLFGEDRFQTQIGSPQILAVLPAILLFAFLAVYESHSFYVGLGFTLGLSVILMVLTILAWILLNLIGRLSFRVWSLKFSFLSLQRRKTASLALFVSLALGSLLINILPQLKVTLQNSMSIEDGSKLPSLFIFDIQDDQVGALKDFFKTHNMDNLNYSAMVRARLLKVNQQDYERKIETQNYKTREEEREARFRNRGVNLTFRETLSSSEEITYGLLFSKNHDPNLAELSVEERYANRMGLKLNDILNFDIQGVEVTGKIVNFRSVRWTSFQPNFFIVMQPGYLEDAPKTFISSLPRLPLKDKLNLERDLAQNFSNISVVDVDHLVTEVLKIAEQMSLSLELMAWLSIIAGYVVLFAIVRTQVESRRWELNMIKILGAQQFDLNIYILSEIFIVAFVGALSGAALSLLASASLSKFIFESSLKINFTWLISSIVGISMLSIIIAWFASRKIMSEKAYHILIEGK